MKILLAAMNAKYIHSNLAVYSLQAYAKKHLNKEENITIELAEYTINQQMDDVLQDIYRQQADVVCFSCYIWNLTYVEDMIRELGKITPKTDIWVGGPEVSYDSKDVLMRLRELKGVMKGEGEETFYQLCRWYAEENRKDEALKTIDGITFRQEETILENSWRTPMDLSDVPFVYEDLAKFEHKIIYYETSRGCPFSCSYCLSSIDKKLRFRPLDMVFQELQFFLDHQISQVKFVDRTFNCKHDHALAIWKYIAEHDNGVTNFHFEVSADLLNEEELKLMKTMRPGLIQLEIGVQTTNEATVREIRRTMDFEKLKLVVEQVKQMGNIHQHLDLIAGLPFENIESFEKSFNDVYALNPEQLQLGFLKVLKGSYMEEQKNAYGLVYKNNPPYEVLYTKWLSYDDVIRLKGVEEMVEVYYNSAQFTHTLAELIQNYDSAFQLYDDLWEYYRKHELCQLSHKRAARYEIFLGFIKEKFPTKEKRFQELLVYDYYLRENAKSRPEFAGEECLTKEEKRIFYEREEAMHQYLKGYEAYDKNQMRKMTHLEKFPELGKIVLFDYINRNLLNQEAHTEIISCKMNLKSIE